MKRILAFGLTSVLVIIAIFGSAILFGTSKQPKELLSVSNPFRNVDFSDLPSIQTLPVPHGEAISFRVYGQPQFGVVIALHGSTGQGASLHPLSKSIAERGLAVYAPDLRGHGATGRRGDVDYIGQPDDDLKELIAHVRRKHPTQPLMLVGFSLGGGFAFKFLGDNPSSPIDQAVLIAPALGPDSPTMKSTGDGWASPHLPRIIALTIINRIGITALNGFEAIAYAVPPDSKSRQTGSYSYRLYRSLMPFDYRAIATRVKTRVTVVIGEKDELFDAAKMSEVFNSFDHIARAIIVPNVDHTGAILDQRAIDQIAHVLVRSKN